MTKSMAIDYWTNIFTPDGLRKMYTENAELAPVKLREDLRAPVLTVVTETDVISGRLLGFYHARQPDSEPV